MLEMMAQIQIQMQEQPDLPLLDDETLSFVGTGSIGATSGDLLSEACSALTETMYETHEDAQNALYNAADSLCQSITYYKTRTTGLEQTVASLENQQMEAQQKASLTEAELTDLRREKKALEDALDEKNKSVEMWMSAKVKAEEEAGRLRKERDDLKKEASQPTQALEEEVERLRTETREKTVMIATMSAQAEVRRQRESRDNWEATLTQLLTQLAATTARYHAANRDVQGLALCLVNLVLYPNPTLENGIV
jgi:chromosome segregation ATPase